MRKFIAAILIACMAMLPAGCQAGQKRAKPERKAPVILVFTAKWCGACQDYKPEYQRLKREGYDVREIDVDTPEGRKAMTAYGVEELPTTVIVKEGKIVSRQVGGLTHDQLIKALKVVGCILYSAVKIAIILI